MGLGISCVKEIQPLPRPSSKAAYDFAWKLAEKASAWGDGIAFGSFEKNRLLNIAQGYCSEKGLSPEETEAVKKWVESLPFDEFDEVTLCFNW